MQKYVCVAQLVSDITRFARVDTVCRVEIPTEFNTDCGRTARHACLFGPPFVNNSEECLEQAKNRNVTVDYKFAITATTSRSAVELPAMARGATPLQRWRATNVRTCGAAAPCSCVR